MSTPLTRVPGPMIVPLLSMALEFSCSILTGFTTLQLPFGNLWNEPHGAPPACACTMVEAVSEYEKAPKMSKCFIDILALVGRNRLSTEPHIAAVSQIPQKAGASDEPKCNWALDTDRTLTGKWHIRLCESNTVYAECRSARPARFSCSIKST